MSNPWAKSFEELRSPYLQEKMAKKDYDGDGKVESGKDEYFGSKDKAIKKAMGKKVDDKKKVAEHHTKDKDGNTIPHGDGSPSSVEEMKKFGPGGDPVKKPDFLNKALDKLKKNTPVKKLDKAHYEPEAEVLEAKVDKRLPSGPFAGGAKDRSQARNLRKFGKKEGGDVPDKKGSHKYNPMASFEKRGNTEKLSKERRKEHEAKRGVKKEEVVIESDKKGSGSGTKDACYKKVKASASVWPSAYASGRLVQCRKKGAANYGNSKKEEFDFRIKSFDELVGECWKTHERVPGTVKGAKGSCRPKGSAKMKEEAQVDEGAPYTVNVADKTGNTPAYQNFKKGMKNKLTGDPLYKAGVGLDKADYNWKEEVFIEALKGKKLDIDDSGKVKNKIEINPEVRSEEAKAPVKK